MSRRHQLGQSLIECLCYLSMGVILLNLGGMLLIKTFRTHRQLDRDCNAVTAMMRTGERWRQDLRTAVREPVVDGSGMWISTAGGPISWRCRDGVLECSRATSGWDPLLRGVAECRWIQEEFPGISAWRLEVELAGVDARHRGPSMSFMAVCQGETP